MRQHHGQDAPVSRAGRLLPAPDRTPSGYRDDDPAVLDRLAFVKAAQAAGLTLAESREVVAVCEAQGPPCGHVAGVLDAHVADLDRRTSELPALRHEVRRRRERSGSVDAAACAAAVCHVIATC